MMFILIVLVRPHREGQSGPLPPSCSEPPRRRQLPEKEQRAVPRPCFPLSLGGESQDRTQELSECGWPRFCPLISHGTSGHFIYFSEPYSFLLKIGIIGGTTFIGLLWGLNRIRQIWGLAQSLAHRK